MAHPGKMVNLTVDVSQKYQKIDGFGVNINSRYWNEGKLIPTMELLHGDLGATLYRVDIWGKSDWVDPSGTAGPAALRPEKQAQVYSGEIFKRGWAMMRWLNQQGIRPYLTASGDVPHWMLGDDGKTLVDFESFTEMMASMVEWARKQEHLDFTLFGPLNETDLGSPEGPTLNPADFVQVCERLIYKLNARGLHDIKLVVPEQAQFNTQYVQALVQSEKLRGRIGAFAMHSYADTSAVDYRRVNATVKNSPFDGTPLWMTEYGDLEQSGEREWYVAWVMTSRLLDQLEYGFNASLVWDAFDNYHDHDGAWTIYGLLRAGLRMYTPKKRYYATKQVFRFVLPGFERVSITSNLSGLRAQAFAAPDSSALTIVGMNDTALPARLNAQISGLAESAASTPLTYYRTSETENCHMIERIQAHGPHWPFTGVDALIPPGSIFTLTTLRE